MNNSKQMSLFNSTEHREPGDPACQVERLVKWSGTDCQLLHGDCLELMKDIPDDSVNMICCDMPYGTTACQWDVIIELATLWDFYYRIIKENGAIVLFSSQPFTSQLITSNIKGFRYSWVWEKDNGTNFMQAKKMPLKYHEDICVFSCSGKNPVYYPVKWHKGRASNVGGKAKKIKAGGVFNDLNESKKYKNISEYRFPKSIIKFNRCKANDGVNKCLHPTQKPLALIEYLIKTYTIGGDVVLDNCMGSGTTGVACRNLNRKFIGIELDKEYFDIATKRIQSI